ncbi:MAG: BamA/TamA family outer membrane protein [Bacteroidota bacterium]|nr:BamA/TamA family outer membrane protein [Bacteroidota bacterium]
MHHTFADSLSGNGNISKSSSEVKFSERKPSSTELPEGKVSSEASKNLIKVDSIIIQGNTITDDDIILRELTFRRGDYISKKDLDYSRERIYSLSLFTNVNLISEASNETKLKAPNSKIVIDVKESWYFWPIPFVDIKENALNKATYGMDIQYKNFRGRNETLQATLGFGYDPVVTLVYNCPLLISEKDIFLSTVFSYRKYANKSNYAEALYGGSFDQKAASGSLTIGKRLNLFNSLSLTLGYDYIESPVYKPGISASNGRIDRTVKSTITYNFDSRDLKQFPDSGLYVNLSYTYKGFNYNKISYSVLSFDIRDYLKLWRDLSAKWRVATRSTYGSMVPFYDYSILGSLEKIRGHYNQIYEGNHFYVGSLEIKYPLLKEWDFSIKLPVVPEELTSYRIGIYPYLFADAGAAQLKGHSISTRDFYSGYGAGMIFLFLPYNIFRVELALDEYKNKEVIFGFGFSF